MAHKTIVTTNKTITVFLNFFFIILIIPNTIVSIISAITIRFNVINSIPKNPIKGITAKLPIKHHPCFYINISKDYWQYKYLFSFIKYPTHHIFIIGKKSKTCMFI